MSNGRKAAVLLVSTTVSVFVAEWSIRLTLPAYDPASHVAWVFFRSDDFSSASRMLQAMFGMVTGEPVLSGTHTIFWVGLLLVIVWFLPNSWQVFNRFNPVLVDRSAAAALTNYRAVPASAIGSKAIMVPLGLAMAVVSILVVIDRGSDTQRFIYMIF